MPASVRSVKHAPAPVSSNTMAPCAATLTNGTSGSPPNTKRDSPNHPMMIAEVAGIWCTSAVRW